MDLGLRDKVALVSAASRGLGRATALALAHEGAQLAICARGDKTLAATADEIRRAAGVDVFSVAADVTQAADISNFVDLAAEHFGRIDILVSNAGGPPSGPFDNFDDRAWQSAFNLTLMSTVRLIRAVLPHMRAAGGGRIVNITSIAVKQPITNLILSNSIRTSVIGLAKSLSFELAKDNILLNNVCPGTYNTDRIRQLDADRAARENRPLEEVAQERMKTIPLGRLGKPEELGALIAFLCSQQAAYITGATIQADGGEFRGLM